tara:strand:- start:1537 stop:1791 length:255 start_codon:yes stop_codon:yes gene_type:complete
MAKEVDERSFKWKDKDGNEHSFPAKDMNQDQLNTFNLLCKKELVRSNLEDQIAENNFLFKAYADQLIGKLGIDIDGKQKDKESS